MAFVFGSSRFSIRAATLGVIIITSTTLPLCVAPAAHAQLNAGVDLGVAKRASDPALDFGLSYGAHLEGKVLESVGVGAYYFGYELALEKAPSTVKRASFHALGLRARYTMHIPSSRFMPYGFAGLGYVWSSYPVDLIDISNTTVAATNRFFLRNDGHFWEAPVGIGLGYRVMDALVMSLDVSLRPSFGFGGEAYEIGHSIDTTTIGFAALLGASVDL